MHYTSTDSDTREPLPTSSLLTRLYEMVTKVEYVSYAVINAFGGQICVFDNLLILVVIADCVVLGLSPFFFNVVGFYLAAIQILLRC